VINLTKSLASDWGQHNIHVNCVAPGLTATKMLRRLEWLPPDTDEAGNPVPPLQFPHGPEHVANLVVFLASEASDHITGELIPIRALLEFDR
jgi:gluconate 5-dehydrogenase